MSDAVVTIRFDQGSRAYRPGETFSGECWLHALSAAEIKAVEISVLWQTSGKGDEDLAVHHFQRLAAENGTRIDPAQPLRFSTTLPNSPLSYHGAIVKVRWCVRVRVFLSWGREAVAEKPFRLGQVPAAKVATS